MQHDPEVSEQVYIWQRKGSEGSEMVRISISELHHWRLALQQLHAQLTHTMRPAVARGKGRSAAGDISFAANAPRSGTVAAIAFTRGNLCVSIASVGSRAVDVRTVAQSLDAAFSELPQRKYLKPKFQTVKRKAIAAKAKRSTAVIESLSEAADGTGWLKVVAPDGEVSREGDVLQYVSPAAGRKQVGIFTAREAG